MLKKKSTWSESTVVETLIGAQVVVHGDLHFRGGLVVEGRIHGRVYAEPGESSTLTLGENGLIEGTVEAPVVIINGRVEGDVHAGERVELASQGRVNGNVHYRVVEMHAGAVLNGSLVHLDENNQSPKLGTAAGQNDVASLPRIVNE